MLSWICDHMQKGDVDKMESILCVDIPVQMISCTDTDGKITPIRFRFRDKTGELITVMIDKVLSEDQDRNRVGETLRLIFLWGVLGKIRRILPSKIKYSQISEILKRLVQIHPSPTRLCQVNVTKFFNFFSAKIAVTRITSLGLW